MKINECSKSAIKQFEHIKKISLVDTNDELGHIELFISPIKSKDFDYSTVSECLLPSVPEFTLSAHTQALYAKSPMKLSQVAREKFKDALKNKGELGEFLLFCFLEGHLDAPQIIAKYELKTAQNMPVHGSDGIHIKQNENSYYHLIFGESKTYATLKSAITDAFNSINEFMLEINQTGDRKSGINFERGLLSQHIEHSVFEDDDKKILEALIYPAAKSSEISIDDAFGVFIGYEIQIKPELKALSHKEFEMAIKKMIMDQVKDIKGYILDKIKKYGLEGYPFYFYLLPFTNIDLNRTQILQDVLK